MNRLSEQERAGLEEVFLSISTHKGSLFREHISHYHVHTVYSFQRRIRAFKAFLSPFLHFKTTTSHKNREK